MSIFKIKNKKIGPLLTEVPNIVRLMKASSLSCSLHISGWNQLKPLREFMSTPLWA